MSLNVILHRPRDIIEGSFAMENIGVEAQVIDSFFVFLQEGFTDKIAVLAMERNFGEAIDIFFELFEEI